MNLHNTIRKKNTVQRIHNTNYQFIENKNIHGSTGHIIIENPGVNKQCVRTQIS